MRIGERRIYSETETRWHVRGMQARRAGKNYNEAIAAVPHDMRGPFYCGWKRVGRSVGWTANSLKQNQSHHTLQNSKHVVRTEVDDLEQACEIIKRQQVSDAIAAGKKQTGLTLKEEFALLRARAAKGSINRKLNPVTLPKLSILQQPLVAERDQWPALEQYEAAMRVRERVQESLAILAFGVEELIATKSQQNIVSVRRLVDLIHDLASAANVAPPALASYKREQKPRQAICENCGEKFLGLGALCQQCQDKEPLHRDSEQRRERERAIRQLETEASAMAKAIRKLHEATHERHR